MNTWKRITYGALACIVVPMLAIGWLGDRALELIERWRMR